LKITKLPNFLIVGTAKAGTSSVAKYLTSHPEVFIPELKEPRYFLHDVFEEVSKEDPMFNYLMESSVLDWNAYVDLYKQADSRATMFGDASIQYLYHHNTVIPKIKEKLGDVPIIIVLRDPVKRAFSNYKYQSNIEFLSFEEALNKEDEKKEKKYNSFWFYKDMGLYYNQVKAYIESFSNVHVCLYDDLIKSPEQFMGDIYAFLNIDNITAVDYTKRHNETVVPKNKPLQYINYIRNRFGIQLNFVPEKYRNALKNLFFQKNKEKIPQEEAQFLLPFFIDDIKKLEKLIDRDLSHWYTHAD